MLARSAPTEAAYRERFWSRVDRTERCWLWTGPCFPNGYGAAYDPKTQRNRAAHRIAWTLVFGPIPTHLFVLHACDVRPCVRPTHLWLGTKKQNSEDMVRKGRSARGVRAPMNAHPESRPFGDRNWMYAHPERARTAKLSAAEAAAIRDLYAMGISQRSLAGQFGISPSNVSKIVLKHIWR